MRAPYPGEPNKTYWMQFENIWFTLGDGENDLPVFKADTPQDVLDSYNAFMHPTKRELDPAL